MKKRIVVFICILTLIFSAFTLSGCGNNSAKKMSAQEIFEKSFKDSFDFSKLTSSSNFLSKAEDIEASFLLTVNKLILGEEVIANTENPISLGIDAEYDSQNSAASLSAFVDVLGEKPTIKTVITKSTAYIVDLLGLTDIPAISFDISEIFDTSELSEVSIDSSQLSEAFISALSASFKANVPDAAYTKTITDVTVDEVVYKNCAEVSLTLTKDIISSVLVDAVNTVKNDAKFKDIFTSSDDFTVEDIDLDGAEKIILVSTVTSDVKPLSFNIDVKDKSDSVLFTFISAFSNNSVRISAGDPTPFINISYSIDENNAQHFKINVIAEESSFDVAFDETFKDGKFEGTASIITEDTGIGLKYSREEKKDGFKFSTSELSFKNEGVTVSLPVELTVEHSNLEKGTKTDLSFKMSIQDSFDIDFSASFSLTSAYSVVLVPETSLDFDQISESDYNYALDKIFEKYPTLASLLSLIEM